MWPTIIGTIFGFLPIVIIIIVLAVLYYGVDPDDGVKYDIGSVRCKALKRKLPYIGEDIRYLVSYMNIILPLMIVYTLYQTFLSITAENLLAFIVYVIIITCQILAVILIRGIDIIGYMFNIAAIIGTGLVYTNVDISISLSWFINCFLGLWYIAYHIKYFHARKEIFFKTVKELKYELE